MKKRFDLVTADLSSFLAVREKGRNLVSRRDRPKGQALVEAITNSVKWLST